MGISEAWKRLTRAASDYETLPSQTMQHELSEAALEYAREWWAKRTGTAARRPDDGSKDGRPVVRVPFGRDKGRTLGECEVSGLRWLHGAVSASVDDPAKERWRAANVALADAIRGELQSRGESA